MDYDYEALDQTYRALWGFNGFSMDRAFLDSCLFTEESLDNPVQVVGNYINSEDDDLGRQVISFRYSSGFYGELDSLSERNQYVLQYLIDIINEAQFGPTFAIDYRFLKNDAVIEALIKKSQANAFALRIVGDDYVLDQETYDKLKRGNFLEIAANKSVARVEQMPIDEENNLFVRNDSKDVKTHHSPTCDFFITRDLSDEEVKKIVTENHLDDVLKISPYYSASLNIRFYNQSGYSDILSKFVKAGLDPKVKISVLSNPLHDNSEDYAKLESMPNEIMVIYHTCQDLINDSCHEPYSRNVCYRSELEGSGTVGAKGYVQVLKSLETFEKKVKDNNYSPLEAMLSAQCYLRENYIYTEDENRPRNARDLDRVILDKSTIVCVGYATLFSAMLRRCDIKCFRYSTVNHVENIARLKDDKYHLDQLCTFDPTNDPLYRFYFFGMSPLNKMRCKTDIDNSNTVEYLTIPKCLVISRDDYQRLAINSASPYNRFYGFDYSPLFYIPRMLELMGYNADYNVEERVFSFDRLFDRLQDLMYRGATTRDIPIATICDALRTVMTKEHPEYSLEEVERNISDARFSYELRENVLNPEGDYRIWTNYPYSLDDDDPNKRNLVSVHLAEPKKLDEPSSNLDALTVAVKNEQLERFEAEAKRIVKIYYDEVLNYLTNFTFDHESMDVADANITKLLTDSAYSELSTIEKESIIQRYENQFENEIYNILGRDLCDYIMNYLAINIARLNVMPECNNLRNASAEYLNTEDYQHDYRVLCEYLNTLINNPLNMQNGVKMSFEDDVLTITFANERMKTYKRQMLSDELIAAKNLTKSIRSEHLPSGSGNEENDRLPVFTSVAYRPLVIPETVEEYHSLYLAIINEVNTKVKEVNAVNSFYESTGMVSISDSKFINNIINSELKADSNLNDIVRYKNDLLNLRLAYVKKFNRSLAGDVSSASELLNVEYYSRIDQYLVFSNQLISVSANEVLELLDRNDSSLNKRINELVRFILVIRRAISHRLSNEMSTNNLDLNSIDDLVKQNDELLSGLFSRVKAPFIPSLDSNSDFEFISIIGTEPVSNKKKYNNAKVKLPHIFLNPNSKVVKVSKDEAIVKDVDSMTITAIKNGVNIRLRRDLYERIRKINGRLALVAKDNYRSRKTVIVDNDTIDLAFKTPKENFDLRDYKLQIRASKSLDSNRTDLVEEYDFGMEEPSQGLKL